jgi:alanine dehydrogenase
VSIRERNREKFDLPTVFSILIYTHPETGFPLAICDGSYHTVMRTGASAAVSAKWLARKNAKKLAIVGAGHMAEGTLATCDTVFAWDEVRIWSRSQATLDEFVKDQAPKYRFPIHASRDLAEVVRGADVVVTVTPAREPLVKDEWIAPGTHIAAVGADKAGDQELDPRILQRAHFRRRHPPMPDRWRDQCAAVQGAHPRAGHCRRNRRSHHRQEAGPPLRR